MGKLTGNGLVKYAFSKIGVPYVYGAKIKNGILTQSKFDYLVKAYPSIYTASYTKKSKKNVGKVCTDCSGLISGYTGKEIGSAQMYSTASRRIPISQIKDMPIGTVLWKSGHVGIYIGKENGIDMCIEAKGVDYGVVKTKVSSQKWQYGLLFSYIDYDSVRETDDTMAKVKNPYPEPKVLLKKGMKGNDVKWLQFELLEAGISKVKVGFTTKTLTIDGDFGSITYEATKVFQSSAKLTVDGLAGLKTIAALKIN